MLQVRRPFIMVTVAVVVGAGLSACSNSRWCEHDATDKRVADRYCEQNIPGYEWETNSGSGSSNSRSTTRRSTTRK